MVVDFSVRDMT